MTKVKITIEAAENVAPITELNETFTTESEAHKHAKKCFERIGLDENTKAIEETKNISHFGKVEGATRWVRIELVSEEKAPAKAKGRKKKAIL